MNETVEATSSVAAQEDKHLGKRKVAPVDPPVPVEVHNEEPLKVEIAEPDRPVLVVTPGGKLSLPPTTTAQEDVVVAGQRQVSLIWETTQAAVTVIVTLGVVYAAVAKIDNQVLYNAFFVIIGFYYSRVNHSAIGGIGRKATDDQVYRGR